MSPAKKKTKAAKPATRKAPARKKPASKPKTTKARTTKAKKAKASKPKTTKARTTKAKKAKASKPKTTRAARPPAKAPVAKPAPPKRAPSRRSKKKPTPPTAAAVLPQRTLVAGEPRSRLGTKWECFSCGAKFYDLNKPEPLCPKCEANQLQRPKSAPKVKPPAQSAPSRGSRAMAPLLEEEEDAMVVESQDIDLGVAGVDEAVGEFIDAGEPEEDVVDEEEEEP
jgi:hypothetical protein